MTRRGIRERRTRLGMSLRELSRRTGINPGRVSVIERGIEPSLDELQRIEDVLTKEEEA